jgi:hypothetical protein
MKKRPFVQGTSHRKQVLRQRRIYTSFSQTWEALRNGAERLQEKPRRPVTKPA